MINDKKKIQGLSEEETVKLIHELALNLYYDVSNEQAKAIVNNFKEVVASFDAFDAIDTTNVQPLNYPIENNRFYLRPDEEVKDMDSKSWLDKHDHDKEGYMELTYEK